MADILSADELPELPPGPDEADIAQPGGGELPTPAGMPRLDVVRKLQRQVAFLQHFRESGVVATACRLTGISTRLLYGFWRKDPLFEAAYQEAQRDAADVIEQELYRRGVQGVDEPVIHMGLPTYLETTDPDTGEVVEGSRKMFTVKKYSDGCLLALIKARKPEKFREHVSQEINVKSGSGVLVVPAAVDQASWEEAATRAQERFRPQEPEPEKR